MEGMRANAHGCLLFDFSLKQLPGTSDKMSVAPSHGEIMFFNFHIKIWSIVWQIDTTNFESYERKLIYLYFVSRTLLLYVTDQRFQLYMVKRQKIIDKMGAVVAVGRE